MAGLPRTVRVSGLPTDIEDDRLKDKLFIHFLRSSNGGGEIDSVIIAEATPGSALITFEDSGVAQRVIHRGQHTLEVDGKRYRLVATEHHERLEPDQVILSLSATISYSQLPGGFIAFDNICRKHRDVKSSFTLAEESCTLSGAYSKVTAALSQLLGHIEGSESPEKNDAAESGQSASRTQETVPQEVEDQKRKPRKQREKTHLDNPTNEYIPSAYRDLTPGGYSWEETDQTASAVTQPPLTSLEEFPLMVDADMFQYLQKHCRKEYQHILSRYGVEAVDVTSQGLTTLFLQAASGGRRRDGVLEQERLKSAREAISRLYQENEATIRRGQLPKSLLPSKAELKRAVQNLSARHAKLLVNEDEKNIYLIGSSSDISEAKRFLLDLNKVRDREEEGGSPPRFSSYAPSSAVPADEERAPLTASSVRGPPDQRIDPMLKSDVSERRVEGTRQFKLAPQFKNAGGLPTDFSVRANSSSGRQTRPGPMLGHDVLSETSKLSAEGVSRAAAQSTGGDILFKGSHASPSLAPLQYKTPSNPDLMDVRPKTPSTGAAHASSSGSTSLLSAGSGATLKRANSFSGTLQRNKSQVLDQKSEDETGRPPARTRGRSSSFSSHTGREKQEVHTAEVTVPLLQWDHMKEAYRTRIDDLTSDVQMKERRPDRSADLTVTLRGANPSKVASCQQFLQKLVDSVAADFSVKELRLSELGVADKADETLQACCSDLRSSFKKVTIKFLKDALYLFGPEPLCAEVVAALRGVFSGALESMHHHRSTTPTSQRRSPSAQRNEDQSVDLLFNSKSKLVPESKTGKADGPSRSSQWQTTYRNDFCEKELVNGSVSQPSMRKDPVVKEKEGLTGTEETDGQRSSLGSDSSVGHVNGVWSTTTSSDNERAGQMDSKGQETADAETTAGESGSSQKHPASPCSLCGASGTSAVRTKCGVTMCSECPQSMHASCRVCHETERKRCGIHGEMRTSKLSNSLVGHPRLCTIVITYRIPDGIQAEGHPSPGKPFRGGEFMAFLPECEKAEKLLPRLEKAFKRGLTFTVTGKGADAKVIWDCIPHKVHMQGGATLGYPDSTYLKRLSDILTTHGIEE